MWERKPELLRLKYKLRSAAHAALPILHRYAQLITARLEVIQRKRARVFHAALSIRRRKFRRNLSEAAAVLNHIEGQLQLFGRAFGGPGCKKESELLGDRLAHRLAQIGVDDDFAEMERMIPFLFIGSQLFRALEQNQTAHPQPGLVRLRDFNARRAHTGFP